MREFLLKYLRGPNVNFRSLVAQYYYERILSSHTPQELFEIAQELGLAKGNLTANYFTEENLIQNECF